MHIEPREIIRLLAEEISGVKSRAGTNPNAVQRSRIETLSAARNYIESNERSLSDNRRERA
jgi:hypothetical protein